jgi:DNA polymerase
MTAADTLAGIAEQVAVCTRCALHHSRKNGVPGEGPATAEIMFIGEGPGFHENEQGRPFVGAAGQLLDQLLQQAGLKRADVWITNVVKCRPPANRDPLPEEITACTTNFLDQQVQVINPPIIVTLGRFSMGKYMPEAKIGAVHGQMRQVGERHVIAMYHPAAALRRPALKPVLVEDFARLPALLRQARAAQGRPARSGAGPVGGSDDPQQLSLF